MRNLMRGALMSFFAITLLFSFAPQAVRAQSVNDQYQDILNQGIIFANICASRDADCACRDNGDCTLRDMIQVAVNVSIVILALSGTLVLAMFVYGGLNWIISDGKPSMIERGKQAIVASVIGLAIVLGSYAIVSLVVKIITTDLASDPIPGSDEDLEDLIPGAEDIFETQ